MTDPRVQALSNQVAAVAAGERTFDEAVDQLVALAEGDHNTGQHALSAEDAEAFRALTAMFVRVALQGRGAGGAARAPNAREQEAHVWWAELERELHESGCRD